jgi:hypothetical protein
MRKEPPLLVGPAAVDICSRPIVAIVALEDIDFECAFEKLCPRDAFSFARFLFFVCGACQWWTLIVLIAPTFGVNEWSWFVW